MCIVNCIALVNLVSLLKVVRQKISLNFPRKALFFHIAHFPNPEPQSSETVDLLDVLVHAVPLREGSITDLAKELLPVVNGVPVHLK